MREEGNHRAECFPRLRLQFAPPTSDAPLSGAIAVMCAGAPGKGYASIRSFGGSPFRAGLLLFDNTGAPIAIMDFAHLQIYRTGCAAAIGAKYLSRPESHAVGVIGSGRMAKAALIAHALVRKLDDVRIYSRNPQNREAFAKETSEATGLEVKPVASAAEAVKGVDIVIVCAGVTRLEDEPAFHGALIEPGQFINALGAPADLDQETFDRADRVVVDDLPEVRAEMLDIRKAVERGLFTWESLDDLPSIVSGKRPGRQRPEEIILSRNRGSAVQDLFPAIDVYQKAVQRGIGTDIGEVIPPRIGF
jgi:ornithine cyclodeaminase/alanine dehydrogenase-like protein (mu-crystallin family)